MFRYLVLCRATLFRVWRGHQSIILENLALRQQLSVLKRRHPHPRIRSTRQALLGRRPSLLVGMEANVRAAGFVEVDLVSHSGNSSSGQFAYSLNLTDIHNTWTEIRAVLGNGQLAVVRTLNEMKGTLPFCPLGIDSDNGSAFINWHLGRWCARRGIQFTRGRPYKKDDNAHIEQKN